MAPEWEIPMGMDYGMSMGMGVPYSTASTVAPFTSTMSSSPAHIYGYPSAGRYGIDDLLDFSNQDLFPSGASATATVPGNQFPAAAEHCLVSGDQSLSASSGFQSQKSSFDLYIPCEEAAELEWLSKFVDDSFSDVPNYQSTCIIPTAGTEPGHLRTDQTAGTGRGARSKRFRAASTTAAAVAWTSPLVPQPPSHSSPSSSSSSSSSSDHFPTLKPKSVAGSHNSNGGVGSHDGGRGKKGVGGGRAGDVGTDGGVRRCTHCASEKTPQWRTGPLGPKTLCNACGVRYKSGRLVPEYRPAASPTFVLTQHSNSHRKVMELRRQKELLLLNSNNSGAAATSRPDLLFQDNHYGVC